MATRRSRIAVHRESATCSCDLNEGLTLSRELLSFGHNAQKKCYPCSRSKPLPMFPVVQTLAARLASGAAAELAGWPQRRQESSCEISRLLDSVFRKAIDRLAVDMRRMRTSPGKVAVDVLEFQLEH